eukprot:7387932-Prymnesium_polylepis.1
MEAREALAARLVSLERVCRRFSSGRERPFSRARGTAARAYLRDPDKDVEADRVRRELRPIVDPRPRREVAVGRLVHRMCDQHPVHGRQQQSEADAALQPPDPARERADQRRDRARPVRRRRLRRRPVGEAPLEHRCELRAQRAVDGRQRRLVGRRL